MGYLQHVEVMTEAILQHIQKGLLHDDVMRDILLLELQQAKEDWLCTTWDDIVDEASLRPWNQAAHNMWLRLAKGLQFCNVQMSLSPVLKNLQEVGELSWSRTTRHLRYVTRRLRKVDGGEPTWAMWNHGNHGEAVAEEERSNFLTVAHWRTLCQGERILHKHRRVLWKIELRDVRKFSREKRGGEQKLPWLLCKRVSSTDQNENLSVAGKGRNQAARVFLPRIAGISLEDSTMLQRYLDLVDWYSLDVFPAEFRPQENMMWHLIPGGRGLRQQRSGAARENSDEGTDTPEEGTQRSLRDWYVCVQADSCILQEMTCDPVKCGCSKRKSLAGPRTSEGALGLCSRSLARAITADTDSFLRGLALWLNEGIGTGQWGNGTEEVPYSPDCEERLLSEIVKDDSIRERVELESLARHAYLDIDGMAVDAEYVESGASGESDEAMADDAPRPVSPIMAVTGILWRVEGALKEADTRMQEGNEESGW
jgi:hypothetical protein